MDERPAFNPEHFKAVTRQAWDKSASGSIRLGIDVLQSRALRILFGELQDAGGNVGCEHISVWTDDHDLLAVHHAAASTLREIPQLIGCCASS
jgi:hypothetical protein